MKIIKVINNNIVITFDKNNQEIILIESNDNIIINNFKNFHSSLLSE